MYEAWVEVVALGMRSLAPHAFLPIQNPYLSFEVAGAGQAPVHTNRSKRPSGRDPNFQQVGGPSPPPTALQLRCHATHTNRQPELPAAHRDAVPAAEGPALRAAPHGLLERAVRESR